MDRIAELEKEFCPPLDSALFHAIISDFDLEIENQLVAAKGILDDLRQSAELESATGFDASGTGSIGTSLDPRETSQSGQGGSHAPTDVTRLTSSAASLNLDGDASTTSESLSNHHDEWFGDLQADQKHAVLAEAFPDLDLESIGETLAACGHDIEKSIEELLTKRYLLEEDHRDEGDVVPKGIDGFIRAEGWQPQSGKRKRRQRANRDILRSDPEQFTQKSVLIPQYSKPVLEDEVVGSSTDVLPNTNLPVRSAPASMSAAAFNLAKQEAFAKAAAAARRSRSDRLMGGAASYYASVGRDAKIAADYQTAKAADEMVARQASADKVDLHGVDVKNAVRIASERVQSWWDAGASEWARQGKVMGNGGFGVVTGVGRHSEGGKAKIAPAVKKALVAEGWRVEDNGGTLWVLGRLRS